jgi:hypothetical protein
MKRPSSRTRPFLAKKSFTGISRILAITVFASSVPAFDRIEVMHSRGIISRVTHVQHPLHFREEFLRECSCFLIAIPVEPL